MRNGKERLGYVEVLGAPVAASAHELATSVVPSGAVVTPASLSDVGNYQDIGFGASFTWKFADGDEDSDAKRAADADTSFWRQNSTKFLARLTVLSRISCPPKAPSWTSTMIGPVIPLRTCRPLVLLAERPCVSSNLGIKK